MRFAIALLAALLLTLMTIDAYGQCATRADSLAFSATDQGDFRFSTGMIEGLLRSDGESLGLSEVILTGTGQSISRIYGWLNHYRVFSDGVRYGRGLRHSPSRVECGADGSVSTIWPANENRPFRMEATYRWIEPHILDVETTVEVSRLLSGFELFLASYFPATFTEVRIPVSDLDARTGVRWLHAPEEDGYRQAFPRDSAALALIEDGRWTLDPNPIEWTVQAERPWPMSLRRDPETGVTVIFMTDPQETFAIYSPHATQRHFALYYSLFGRDLRAGETAQARARAVVMETYDEEAILRSAEAFFGRIPPAGY